MGFFTNTEVEQWKTTATLLKAENERLKRKVEESDKQISDLKHSEWELQRQIRNGSYHHEPQKKDPSYDDSQLQRIMLVTQQLTKVKPLRHLPIKSGLEILFFDKEKVESMIQKCGEDPKIIIPIFAKLGLIEAQEGFQYACRVEGKVIRGYALVRDRIMWYAHDALKPSVEGD